MNKRTSSQQGFHMVEVVIGVVVVVALIGVISWRVYDSQQQARVNDQKNSAAKQDALTQNTNEKTTLETQKTTTTTQPSTTTTTTSQGSSTAATPSTTTTRSSTTTTTSNSTSTSPSSTTSTSPWQILRPDSTNCPAGSTKTVYSTVEAGAPVYDYDLDSPSRVVGSLAYKASKTGVCYITAGKVWIQYNGSSYPNARYLRAQDVSLTAPN